MSIYNILSFVHDLKKKKVSLVVIGLHSKEFPCAFCAEAEKFKSVITKADKLVRIYFFKTTVLVNQSQSESEIYICTSAFE